MPDRPLRPCAQHGCGALTRDRYCPAHTRTYDQRRGSAASRDYGGAWRRKRARILARDPVCRTAGCGRPSTDVDHVIPRGRPGSTEDDDNLQGLCHACHSSKTAREDGRWG